MRSRTIGIVLSTLLATILLLALLSQVSAQSPPNRPAAAKRSKKTHAPDAGHGPTATGACGDTIHNLNDLQACPKPTPKVVALELSAGKSCPPDGAPRNPDGGIDKVTNHLKNRVDIPETYHLVTVDFITGRATPSLPQPKPLSQDRSKLDLTKVTPYEGAAISAVGYVKGVRVENQSDGPGKGGESTNCYSLDASKVDWHMYLVANKTDGEPQSVNVETTPRIRGKSDFQWDEREIDRRLTENQLFRIGGWLMFDPEHQSFVGKSRATLWEIHPITKIEVSENDGGTWLDLGKAVN
jgi:hypothetical protein